MDDTRVTQLLLLPDTLITDDTDAVTLAAGATLQAKLVAEPSAKIDKDDGTLSCSLVLLSHAISD